MTVINQNITTISLNITTEQCSYHTSHILCKLWYLFPLPYLRQMTHQETMFVLGLGQTSNCSWDESSSNLGRPKLS